MRKTLETAKSLHLNNDAMTLLDIKQ